VVTYIAVVAVSNPELKLKPGMTANVKILVARREKVLAVPNAAFRIRLDGQSGSVQGGPGGGSAPGQRGAQATGTRGGGQPGMGAARSPEAGARSGADRGGQRIYVLQQGKPVDRTVRTGLSDGERTEIVDGLKEGEVVVVGLPGQSRGSGQSGGPPRMRL
jgi:HlyD family secretion protein